MSQTDDFNAEKHQINNYSISSSSSNIIEVTIIIINLIYIAQFDTNGILRALYIVITNAICARMNIHETIIFIHIYMSTHKHTHRHMYKYICTNILTRFLPILT